MSATTRFIRETANDMVDQKRGKNVPMDGMASVLSALALTEIAEKLSDIDHTLQQILGHLKVSR